MGAIIAATPARHGFDRDRCTLTRAVASPGSATPGLAATFGIPTAWRFELREQDAEAGRHHA
jgi:hypothetical protein